jgi:hypothetical protein
MNHGGPTFLATGLAPLGEKESTPRLSPDKWRLVLPDRAREPSSSRPYGRRQLQALVRRGAAERVVEDWDRDEPDRAGLLRTVAVELETAPN